MKAALLLVLLLSMISLNESNLLGNLAGFTSELLRADILDIVNCILHNDKIIAGVNVIIDAILTKNFDNILVALSQFILNDREEITKCINDPLGRLL